MDTIGSADELHTAAAAITGLSDFGPPDYLEGLEVVLTSYEKEADLTPDGVRLIRDELCGILAARLFSEAGFRQHPDHAEVPVDRPVFIIGLPRTGTTTLHRLLTADPANQGLELWLTYAPQPRPPLADWPADPVFQLTAQGVDGFFARNPDYRGIHDRTPGGVEECWLLTRQSMLSAYFEFTASVPSYSAWLAGQDWTGAYRRHRRNLQLIGLNGRDRRWILKSSSHLPCLDALFATYPDARVIVTHRRPAGAVLGSACSMVSRLAGGVSATFHGAAIGPALLDLAERALATFAADRAKYDPAKFYDVEFDTFTADPLAVVADIYRHLGWELPEAVRPAMKAVLAEDARVRSHRYDLADFGVTAAAAEARIGALL